LRQSLVITYFTSTTLSLVGMGDFHPWSEYERLAGVLLLLVSLVSFLVMISHLMALIEVQDSTSSEMSSFFKTLRKFNEDLPLKDDIEPLLTSYFDFR